MMITLLLSGFCIWCVVGIVVAIYTVFQGAGICLLWWLVPAKKYGGRYEPPKGPTPEEWVRQHRKGPPPIPPEALKPKVKRDRFGRELDEHGIPYL